MKIGPYLILLRRPSETPLFSERNRIGVTRIPLGRGWRITIRRWSEW